VSGAENGAEQAENQVSESGAVSGHSRKRLMGMLNNNTRHRPKTVDDLMSYCPVVVNCRLRLKV